MCPVGSPPPGSELQRAMGQQLLLDLGQVAGQHRGGRLMHAPFQVGGGEGQGEGQVAQFGAEGVGSGGGGRVGQQGGSVGWPVPRARGVSNRSRLAARSSTSSGDRLHAGGRRPGRPAGGDQHAAAAAFSAAIVQERRVFQVVEDEQAGRVRLPGRLHQRQVALEALAPSRAGSAPPARPARPPGRRCCPPGPSSARRRRRESWSRRR